MSLELPEEQRLREDGERSKNWKRWGPYLPDRQWSTVREDYSANSDSWGYFGHDQARSRVYRWGEDGLLGICDRECRMAFAIALWNHHDPILKERLFGVTGPEGNHGEDVKECYYHLDSTPTHSYMRALYKYPQSEFPYQLLLDESAKRDRTQREFEITDSGIFEQGYFDVFVEYAKGNPNDIAIRVSIVNRGKNPAPLTLLPTLWFRNVWSWGREGEGYGPAGTIKIVDGKVEADHLELGKYRFEVEGAEGYLFTDNETNKERLYNVPNPTPYVKDGFHRYIVNSEEGAVNPAQQGNKCAGLLRLQIPAGETVEIRIRLYDVREAPLATFGTSFDRLFARSLKEADEFYARHGQDKLQGEQASIWRQAIAGLMWSKKFYYYAVYQWLKGDPTQPPPPIERWQGRNAKWASNLYNRDVLIMPDGWEYPWYASWDSAFHVLPLARIDPELAKEQLILLMREWYMHPNGQIPSYEFSFDDVNPPVHAWAALRLFHRGGSSDRPFLEKVFHKLLINFTWWVNRTDQDGKNVFTGGFLGMDNIGVFDRSRFPKDLGHLEQADATAWMAFYCLRMLQIAMELAKDDPVYEDVASKFFEHFVHITASINSLGDIGLWDEEDGFYYDMINSPEGSLLLKVRSLVGLIPLIAVEILDCEHLSRLPSFQHRIEWFLNNRRHLASFVERKGDKLLLSVVPRERMQRILKRALDPQEFLSDYGLRSLSRYHEEHPYEFSHGGEEWKVDYEPAESVSGMFGGNSNWRGPVWFPINYLLAEALERFYHFYGDELQFEFPTGSRKKKNLLEISVELQKRLISLFVPDKKGQRPAHGGEARYSKNPDWKYLVLFYEYFDGNTGRGLGASHQTGWTALVASLLESAQEKEEEAAGGK